MEEWWWWWRTSEIRRLEMESKLKDEDSFHDGRVCINEPRGVSIWGMIASWEYATSKGRVNNKFSECRKSKTDEGKKVWVGMSSKAMVIDLRNAMEWTLHLWSHRLDIPHRSSHNHNMQDFSTWNNAIIGFRPLPTTRTVSVILSTTSDTNGRACKMKNKT